MLCTEHPTNISTKNIIKSVLNVDQTALRQPLRHIGVDIAFFGILVGIILMVNGIIALIGGTVILIHDWRRGKHKSISR